MLEAVLFDWNNTLVEFTWDDALLYEGHRAALAAIGSDEDPEAFTARYRPLVLEQATPDDPYPDLLRSLLGPLTDEQVDAWVDAEHAAWRPAHQVLGSAQALLESLRQRGLKTGIVVNSWPEPPRVLRAAAEAYGLAQLLDVQVYSAEVGVRKPAPEIFLRACADVGVEPRAALHVGDDLAADVQGAAAVGMTTVQALWFRADDIPEIEPDFQAFTAMDVLNIALRLARDPH